MRIMITGATSMIGWALTQKLVEQGHEVVAVVRRETDELKALQETGRVEVIRCDMSEYGSALGRIDGTIDAAALLAWNGTRGATRMDAEQQQKNLEYSLAAVRLVLEAGCKRIVTAGSQAEYGPHTEQITEETLCTPNTEYGKAKLAFYQQADKLCTEAGATCIEPRFFSLYGPGDYEGTLVMSMLKKMRKGEPCDMTECTQQWDYLYIDDAVAAVALLLTDRGAKGVYNIGSGDNHPLRYYVEEMHKISRSKSALCFGKVPYTAAGKVDLNPSVNKLMALDWRPKMSFTSGIMRIIETL